MPNDTEKQHSNSIESKRGKHWKGKKLGNNLALDTSKQPTPEQKSNGWSERNIIVKTLEEVVKAAQETKHITEDQEGSKIEISLYGAPMWNAMQQAARGDLKATDIVYKYTTALKIEQRLTDKDGKDVKNSPIIVFSSSKEDLLKELNE